MLITTPHFITDLGRSVAEEKKRVDHDTEAARVPRNTIQLCYKVGIEDNILVATKIAMH